MGLGLGIGKYTKLYGYGQYPYPLTCTLYICLFIYLIKTIQNDMKLYGDCVRRANEMGRKTRNVSFTSNEQLGLEMYPLQAMND